MTAPARTRPLALAHPLILIRHGETDWNAAGRLQGREDVPLNERGRRQAARNGRALGHLLARRGLGLRDVAFVASPLARAAETMRLVGAEVGLDPAAHAHDARLVELGFGRWEGLTYAEVARVDPDGHAAREVDPWNARPPGGESMAEAAVRVAPLLGALSGPTVLVTHGGLIRVMHVLLGLAGREAVRQVPTPQDRFHVVADGRMEWV